MPHFRIVNTRNIRAVFHRYNLKYNKGLMPPLDGPQPPKAGHLEGAALSTEQGTHPASDVGNTNLDTPKGGGDDQVKNERVTAEDVAYDDGVFEDNDCQCTEHLAAARRRAERDNIDGDAEAEAERLRYSNHCLGPDIWGKAYGFPMCCCQYRQMSAMELQTFWKVRGGSDIRGRWMGDTTGRTSMSRPILGLPVSVCDGDSERLL